MKVKRNTESQLIIANIPWLIGSFLVIFILIFVGIGLGMVFSGEWAGLIFVLAGGGVGALCFIAFVRRMQMIFDRPSDTILIRRRSVFGYSQTRLKLSELDRVTIETSTTSKGARVTRPTMIMTDKTRIPIVAAYTNTGGPERIRDAITDWLSQIPNA